MCVPATGTGLSPSKSPPAPAETPWKPPAVPLGWCNLQPAVGHPTPGSRCRWWRASWPHRTPFWTPSQHALMAPVSAMEALWAWIFGTFQSPLISCQLSTLKKKKGVFLVAAFLVFSLPLLEEKKEFHMSLIGAQYQNRKSAGGQTLMWVKFCFTVRQKQKIDLQKSFCLFTFVSHG